MSTPTAVVLLAHGSPDPDWARPLEAVVESLRRRLGAAVEVRLCFLGAGTPDVPTAVRELVDSGHRHLRVVCAFLSAGGRHLKHDVPELVEALRGEHPGVRIELQAGALGAEPEVVEAMAVAVARLLG